MKEASAQLTDSVREAWHTIEKWKDLVSKRDISSVVALYCEKKNAFWGTFGNHVRCSQAEVRTYFDRFLDVESIHCEMLEKFPREITSDVVNFTGSYAFKIQAKGASEISTAKARFTFTLSYNSEKKVWRIVEHHSSLMPENGY